MQECVTDRTSNQRGSTSVGLTPSDRTRRDGFLQPWAIIGRSPSPLAAEDRRPSLLVDLFETVSKECKCRALNLKKLAIIRPTPAFMSCLT